MDLDVFWKSDFQLTFLDEISCAHVGTMLRKFCSIEFETSLMNLASTVTVELSSQKQINISDILKYL